MAGGKEMDFRNFIYIEDDEDLSLLPKEPSPGFGTGSPSVSVNTEPLKADEELVIRPAEVTAKSKEILNLELFVVHPGSVAARIKDKKCKTREGSSRPPDDVPYLTVSNDDKDNHMDVELLDLHDSCYARQVVVDNTVNRRSRELLQIIEKLRGEFDVMKDKEMARKEECEELRAKCEVAITEFEKNPTVKWAGYHQSLSTLESKVTSLEGKKASLKAVEVPLRKEVRELKRIEEMWLVSFQILYGRCRVYEQAADMIDPFDLSKVKDYRSSYKKDHTWAGNDLANTTFPWLDEFVADPPTHIEA
uniref:Uncharacterized protein n=1 Tax=Tanacetum cinerariifolium TaxID=118510 RepID=A0A6L2JKN2_TANCI|nr:hypothetical protein [Tanacetum cinerariifolium]